MIFVSCHVHYAEDKDVHTKQSMGYHEAQSGYHVSALCNFQCVCSSQIIKGTTCSNGKDNVDISSGQH